MKLSALLCCVAATSLVACADVGTTGGGQMEGMVPAKFVLTHPSDLQLDPHTQLQQRPLVQSGDQICGGCDVIAFGVLNDDRVDEVLVVSDGGMPVCRIYLQDDKVVLDECGWVQN